MKKVLIWMVLLLLQTNYIWGTIYEDGELGNTSKWTITDIDPIGATVQNVFDTTTQSKVITFLGQNYDNQYTIGDTVGGASAWNDTNNFYFSWSLKSSEGFFIDVILETTNGLRYIRYSDDDIDQGIDVEYINQGLGYDASDGNWHNFIRDLDADLKEFEANNTIISVNGLEIRGSITIDNIELLNTPVVNDFKLYEDAEDGTTAKWIISDNVPSGATINNIFDSSKGSKVIKLQSSNSYENQYQLGNVGWNNSHNFNIKWDMLTTEGYIIDVQLTTLNGERYLRYTDNDESFKGLDGDTVYYGIGTYTTNGAWHTLSRNLKEDFLTFEPNNPIISVDSFLIRANASIDNVELFSSPNKVYEDAEDGKIDRWSVYLGPQGSTISNITDATRQSKVISLQGAGYSNQYIIGGDTYDSNGWKDTKHTNIKWSMQNSDGFIIYVNVLTQNGARFLKYSDSDFSQNGISGEEIYYGLGFDASNGLWHTFIRDIATDIKTFEPNNELTSIEGFQVIGNAKIDDLELFSILHPVPHEAGLALTFDDYDADGWYSLRTTFADYGAKATFFVSNVDRLSPAQITKLHTLEQDGNEIGCHTYDHLGVQTDFQSDVSRITEYLNSQIIPLVDWMNAEGFNPQSFAYPYGEHEVNYDNAVRAYFPYLRTTASDPTRKLYQLDEVYHQKGKNYNILAGEGIDNSYNQGIEDIRTAFIKAREKGEVITLYGHQILNDVNNPFAVSAQKIQKVLEMAKELGLKSYTFKESYLLGN